MPRSSSSVLRDLPIAPRKPVSPSMKSYRQMEFSTGMPSCLKSCPGRAQDSARRHAAGHAHQRVRVRRALDLQSLSAGRGMQSRSFASPFDRMLSRGSQSPDTRAACAADAAAGLPQRAQKEQLSSLDETSDWQGSGRCGFKGRRGLPPLSRKRSEALPPSAARNMRARCAAWNPTAAAAHTLGRLQLTDDC
ncbi:hypothetical protein WJX75_006218 [Coccomyxa subellipsoidea]|uniref:Uncharacterized protein n=1 Tax=Coccomyxa subellipsoidea TaxID=248742 RepID=A0ABR2YF61_9CHLO